MKLHFLVEGPSEVAFVERWATRLLPGHEIRAHPHQGKGRLPRVGEKADPRQRGLLDQLAAKLRGFGRSLDPQLERVVILVDADADPCVELLRRLDELVKGISPAPTVLFRIAIEELEAFYLGDLAALAKAFPEHDREAARQYVPDSICGTAELFGKIIDDGGLNKVKWAEAMGPRVTTNPARSRSPSFKKLVSGLTEFVDVKPESSAKRTYRHTPRPKKPDGKR